MNPVQRLIRLESQSVTTEDSPLSPLVTQQSGLPSIQREGHSTSSSSASTTSEPLVMLGQPPIQPLTVEDMLMNLQNSITAMQQRSTQIDANIACLNELQLLKGKTIANQDITALMAKMAKLEESIAKAEKVKASGIDLDRLCLYPNAKLPEKFKMPNLAKFDGSGDPRTHLYSYHAAMKFVRNAAGGGLMMS
ncbi:hypothetical protein RHMOL_Rhmol06G0153200 [Rhododendron molle]|uniref:Uncharacterized protein n=1 Tax=Rhododendron molle TaxID=49168 RepID=A0ACC0NDP8_RHOML|nr:hypothetical protein RHMOL_Rhmol06G0153200 [Rhododendron molle]